MWLSTRSLSVESDLRNLAIIREFVAQAGDRMGLSPVRVDEIRLAVDEACSNIILHGYKSRSGKVDITVHQGRNKMVVVVSDTASPYNPLLEACEPDLDSPLTERPFGGLGVLLVKQNTDNVEYEVTPTGGNTLTLTKFISKPDGPSDG